jgi:hypothetical protein
MDQPKSRSAQQGPVDLVHRIDEYPGIDLVSSRNKISREQHRSEGLCGVLTQVFLIVCGEVLGVRGAHAGYTRASARIRAISSASFHIL